MNLTPHNRPRPVSIRPQAHHSQVRVIRHPSHATGNDCAGRMVVSGRIDQVCKALQDMLAQAH
jgi:hypothetical protein